MIAHDTGALLLPAPGLAPGLTLSALLACPLGRGASCYDMGTGWTRVELGPRPLGGRTFFVCASFEGERLDGYALCDADPRFGSSWDDASKKKELARRDAHDAWLMAALGAGGKRQPQLAYALAWGEAWSSYDPLGGSSSIGVRFRRF